MKSIKKGKEPSSLKALRRTPGAIYTSPQSDWQDQLLKEQGHLCAYCMCRISTDRKNGKPQMEIEHYQSRKMFSEKGLIWSNMLGVCNGNKGLIAHCDKTKFGKIDGKVQLNVLDPRNVQKSEQLITYSLSGKILANTKNETLQTQVTDDIKRILNLNDEKLIQFRKDAMDRAKEKLKKDIPLGVWTKKDIDKAVEYWKAQKDGKFQAYCQAAIWFLEKLKMKPIHS